MSRGSVVCVVTRLQAGGPGFRILEGANYRNNVQTATGAHPASCLMNVGILFRGLSGRDVML